MENDKFKKLDSLYLEYENEFNELQVSSRQSNLIVDINRVLDLLDLGDKTDSSDSGFNTWNTDKLIGARQKLARYSETISEYITYHESRSDFAWIWRKGAYASDWQPTKNRLKMELVDKITNPEIDNALTEKYLGEQFYSMFHRRRADYLLRKITAMDRMIKTIDHRLWELSRQYNLPQDGNYTPPNT